MNSFHVLIVDDHPALGYGTKMIVEQVEFATVVGIAQSGDACMELTRKHQPHLIFLDYNLPDIAGYDLAAQIRNEFPLIHIVIFTGVDYMPMLNELLELKVSGVLSKEATDDQIRNMVAAVASGQTVIPIALFHQFRLQKKGIQPQLLTDEEVWIMTQIVKGTTNEQIAEEIHMSKRSVDNYVRKIYEKLGVTSRPQAVEKFIEYRQRGDRHGA